MGAVYDPAMGGDMQGQLTISRQTGDGERISIRIRDERAGIEFVELTLTLEQYAQAISGLSCVPCEVEVQGLENVGKRLEVDTLEFPLGSSEYGDKRKEVAAKLAAETCPAGWTPDLHFGSQNSFFQRDGETWARCTIRRWS